MSKTALVVVGNGMVGHQFLQSLADSGRLNEFEVTVFCEEPRLAYDRVYLSSYFTGATAEDLAMGKIDQYREWGLNVLLNERVVEINKNDRLVVSDKGTTLSYDKLVMATGSYPFVPPVPGHDRDHCLVYRTIEDLEAIKASAAQGKVGVVVGGGLLGLEAAKALRDLGLETHVVEFAPRLMAVQLDEMGGGLLRSKIEALGVQVHTGKNTQQIVDGEHHVHRMEFADGEVLETDLILFSAGIRPRDQLARESGLAVGERGGIHINNRCQTSDENIYAIGECALWDGKIFGLVAPGYAMAKVAVAQLNGGEAEFAGADMSTKLKLMGVDVCSIGDAQGRTPGAKNFTWLNEAEGTYKKLVISSDNKKLLGAILVGDAESYGTLLQYMLNEIDLPANPESMILPSVDGAASAGLGVAALPETAQICSCHDVSKGDVQGAVAGGCCSLGDVKGATKAGTGCGGCVPLLTSLVNHELEALGVEVSHDLCEHFAFTRQDLYNLIRVEGIHSFDELMAKHGKGGKGCHICKPAVGSILASCWNNYVLDPKHVILQDTNDTFLANMQKDGTYSIVPRIAGGEITPDKLIVLGEVARDYNLYTKITGGQRVDLFGARLEQLPEIWGRLIDAGFETGHAYGKSVRTVKSCVGSTWCRFGVDDSVGLAIDIENRYKGLRAPHKIKFAVSGCTRECAEAQSKDIGVIATENGWNLYVCGNGGMKPRHADLFATDLDKETLIKYIDRVLMFYIRTADRLQRTSVWMDNLEGGLDYLRDVVINDSLALGDELESQMQHVVETYECEWKKTVNDEQALKRFRQFVNSDKSDSNVVFVQERGQIRPARPEEKEIEAQPIVMA
ncbi:nitrite reductase large subunit NirB [Marinobacterium mangrovicola]|uniref:Assimilatory nitrite reductase (NAD(P)H) large subunit n=1 Tax=Marinobacterium mangrovicola TaxID=1476959 RepID=A0A4R1GM29_9GAMM|nr:nitrite reductase large subunit NirB [Marinobacterium mangrovicola]TCK08191.1 assimilatory nitrite reductase (NAD(P)H) large subunit precursor [Marinobacterium mangrovicola]